MIIVRYADDFISGFEYESDARPFLDAMRERLGKIRVVAASREDPPDRVWGWVGQRPELRLAT
jgi:hypothetical protein